MAISHHVKVISTPTPKEFSMSGKITMQALALRQLSVILDDEQALSLWEEVKAELMQRGMENTVKEVESSTTGNLDTYPRNDVLLVFAVIMTDHEDWPCNGDRKSHGDFVNQLVATLKERGYTPA
jgi:hypothetical protein